MTQIWTQTAAMVGLVLKPTGIEETVDRGSRKRGLVPDVTTSQKRKKIDHVNKIVKLSV